MACGSFTVPECAQDGCRARPLVGRTRLREWDRKWRKYPDCGVMPHLKRFPFPPSIGEFGTHAQKYLQMNKPRSWLRCKRFLVLFRSAKGRHKCHCKEQTFSSQGIANDARTARRASGMSLSLGTNCPMELSRVSEGFGNQWDIRFKAGLFACFWLS